MLTCPRRQAPARKNEGMKAASLQVQFSSLEMKFRRAIRFRIGVIKFTRVCIFVYAMQVQCNDGTLMVNGMTMAEAQDSITCTESERVIPSLVLLIVSVVFSILGGCLVFLNMAGQAPRVVFQSVHKPYEKNYY